MTEIPIVISTNEIAVGGMVDTIELQLSKGDRGERGSRIFSGDLSPLTLPVDSPYWAGYTEFISGDMYIERTSEFAGDGSSTFNVPDLRGRVIAGLDNMGGAANANRVNRADSRGQSGGAQAHELTTSEMPSHRHTTTTHYVNVNQGSQYEMTGTSGAARQDYTGYTGSGSAHNNMQPTMLLNYIIKT